MQYTGCLKMTREQALRRDFFRVGSLGFLGIAAAAGVSGAKAQSVILLWLEGGPSHVDTWDPKSKFGIQGHLDECPRHSGFRAVAPGRQAHGQGGYRAFPTTRRARTMRLPDM